MYVVRGGRGGKVTATESTVFESHAGYLNVLPRLLFLQSLQNCRGSGTRVNRGHGNEAALHENGNETCTTKESVWEWDRREDGVTLWNMAVGENWSIPTRRFSLPLCGIPNTTSVMPPGDGLGVCIDNV